MARSGCCERRLGRAKTASDDQHLAGGLYCATPSDLLSQCARVPLSQLLSVKDEARAKDWEEWCGHVPLADRSGCHDYCLRRHLELALVGRCPIVNAELASVGILAHVSSRAGDPAVRQTSFKPRTEVAEKGTRRLGGEERLLLAQVGSG
eukprot:scaffold7165_cov115-Isochrysis_galbana.AAC.2